jgi:hypothetical protein
VSKSSRGCQTLLGMLLEFRLNLFFLLLPYQIWLLKKNNKTKQDNQAEGDSTQKRQELGFEARGSCLASLPWEPADACSRQWERRWLREWVLTAALDSFSRASVTKSHRPHGLTQKVIFSQFCLQKSEIKVSAGLVSSKAFILGSQMDRWPPSCCLCAHCPRVSLWVPTSSMTDTSQSGLGPTLMALC